MNMYTFYECDVFYIVVLTKADFYRFSQLQEFVTSNRIVPPLIAIKINKATIFNEIGETKVIFCI